MALKTFDFKKHLTKLDPKRIEVPAGFRKTNESSLQEMLDAALDRRLGDKGEEETLESALDFSMPELEHEFGSLTQYEIGSGYSDELKKVHAERKDRLQRMAANKGRKPAQPMPDSGTGVPSLDGVSDKAVKKVLDKSTEK